ncbi:response regulator transcription factor [Pelagibacterium mangrovi]|uniref:response regulator transcription factor n=1 Tax=Pelagibacterium mangrovi TaxID=3119828 RepID=UPI002FCB7846
MRQITIAFFDDHPAMLRGLVSIFSEDNRFSVVGSGSSADEAWTLVADNNPDIVVLDLSMPGDVFKIISDIARSNGKTRVVIFTAFSSTDSAIRTLDAGATGFALKGSPIPELVEAIEGALAGQLYVGRQFATQVLTGLRERAQRRKLQEVVSLNVREKQIVAQLLQARTNKEIAQELHLSEKTVKHYMSGLMLKLKARNRVEVVIAARRHQDAVEAAI